MFSLHVRLDDRTLQYLRLFIAFSHTTRDTLRAKAKMSTNSGHLRAVQPTQLRSPSNTDHTIIPIARQRYLEKNLILGACDPFTAPADIFISLPSTKFLPELQCGDIYIYLIENPSPYTSQKLKAYKSTDSYLIFRSGWVHNAVVWKVKTKNIFIIRAKMSAIYSNS